MSSSRTLLSSYEVCCYSVRYKVSYDDGSGIPESTLIVPSTALFTAHLFRAGRCVTSAPLARRRTNGGPSRGSGTGPLPEPPSRR